MFKFFMALALTIAQVGESMDKRETLKEFEHFYESIQPAQENNEAAFVWLSHIPHPLFNAVIHLSTDQVSEKVDAILAEASSERPISFWLHPENRAEGLKSILQAHSFQPLITCPLMAWAVKPVAAHQRDIRVADRETFHDVLSVVYEFEPAMKEAFAEMMDGLECENYIMFEDGKAVSVCSLFVRENVGGIFNDATLPERREASEDMMRFLMQRSHEIGLQKLIVLSSPEGEELYADLGFSNLFDIEILAR